MSDPDTAAVVAAEPAPAGQDYEALIAHWFNERVANSPASRNIDAINYLMAVAIPALIAQLKKGA